MDMQMTIARQLVMGVCGNVLIALIFFDVESTVIGWPEGFIGRLRRQMLWNGHLGEGDNIHRTEVVWSSSSMKSPWRWKLDAWVGIGREVLARYVNLGIKNPSDEEWSQGR